MRRMKALSRGRIRRVLTLGLLSGVMLVSHFAPVVAAPSAPEIAVLSGRADLVTGGNALVEITLPPGTSADGLRVSLNGGDITDAFTATAGSHYRGLAKGLVVGPNTLTAQLGGGPVASITMTNHPDTGPVFAGGQVQPWVCATAANGLGTASDPVNCHAASRADLYYRSSVTGQFASYDPANPPTDMATTTTDQGVTMPFVVRVETGTIDRGIYKFAVLYDPSKATDPMAALRAYNGKALIPFAGGCTPDHHQDAPPSVLGAGPVLGVGDGSVNADYALGKGFVVMSSSNNYLGHQCNVTVSAETLMMLKEHVIKETGRPIRYTIGQGCSGGSVQQMVIGATYPGLLDGLIPMCSFPDLAQVVQEAEDCTLMNRVFNQTSPALWANVAQRDATQGYVSPTPCMGFYDGDVPANPGFAKTWFDPSNAAGCNLPQEEVYDPDTNPGGVRCTVQDYTVSMFGRRASDGFANRPYDNVGVQYGLQALESGEITPGQFVDLNANVGGWDIDWNWQPQRSEADPAALVNAYRSGWVTSARELAKVPIVDLRGSDPATNHTDVHSYSIRARLDRDNGGHANEIMWTGEPAFLNDPAANHDAFVLMDGWLARIEADQSGGSLQDKVIADKPTSAVDSCWIAGKKITDMSACRAAFPYFADSRIVSGGPLTDDVLKCQLKPLDRAGYGAAFTDEEWARLQHTFPDGVCDFSRPGVSQQPAIPWLTFAGGPGGQPLGTPPQSTTG